MLQNAKSVVCIICRKKFKNVRDRKRHTKKLAGRVTVLKAPDRNIIHYDRHTLI
jgi:hypothetical protein